MPHPVQRTIESLHAEGACPRLHVNLLAEGAVAPDFVVERWGEELVIDLDPSYPLELEFTELGVEANLSFGGYVTRCVFPYASIYVVANRETGRGIVLEQHMPEAVRAKRRPQIQVKSDGAAAGKPRRSEGGSRRKRRKSPEAEPAAAPAPAPAPTPAAEARPALAAVEADDAPVGPPSDSEAAEEKAKQRRSAFRVIDGGE